jgi:hypothetical protein
VVNRLHFALDEFLALPHVDRVSDMHRVTSGHAATITGAALRRGLCSSLRNPGQRGGM